MCQVMVDLHIIEQLSDGNMDAVFHDSTTKLYQFVTFTDENNTSANETPNHMSLNVEPGRPSASSGSHRSFKTHRTDSPDILKPGRRVVHELVKLSNIWRRHNSAGGGGGGGPTSTWFNQSRFSLADTSGAPCSGGGVAPSSDSSTSLSDCSAEFQDVLRETALYALTQMLELPILDGIIESCLAVSTPPTHPATATCTVTLASTISSTSFVSSGSASSNSSGALKRYKSICIALADETSTFEDDDDRWWTAALRCVDFMRRGPSLLDPSPPLPSRSDLAQKCHVYRLIAADYVMRPVPLWPDEFGDVHREFYRLLMEGREARLLRSMQVALLLLDDAAREEMKRLLAFLRVAGDAGSVPLSTTETNSALVQREFTPVLLRSKLLTPHQLSLLLLFMLQHSEELWALPDDIADLVNCRLNSTIDSTINQASLEPAYCQRVSSDEFSAQKAVATEEALVAMMNAVFDNTRMALKEKAQLLDSFKVHHAELWRKHFSHIA